MYDNTWSYIVKIFAFASGTGLIYAMLYLKLKISKITFSHQSLLIYF